MSSKSKSKPQQQYPTVDHRQKLTDSILVKMEEAVKFETPWFRCAELPFNPVTGTHYKGINFVSTMLAGYDDPRFYTMKNIQELAEKTGLDLHVTKGSKGLAIFKAVQVGHGFAEPSDSIEEGEPQVKSSGSHWEQKWVATVFNASQIEGLPPYERTINPNFTPIEEAELVKEAMIQKTGLTVEHHGQGRAFYAPSQDKVMLPHPERFTSSEKYYETMLHEFGHATGHESRVGREMKGRFGDEKYAFEELVAELTSYYMGAEIGMPYDGKSHENHAAYLKSWIGALKDDKSFIFTAASHANRATDYQLNVKNELKLERLQMNLIEAVHAKDVMAIDQCLSQGTLVAQALIDRSRDSESPKVSFINLEDSNGNNILHHAASAGDLKITAHLIEQGGDFKKMNHQSNTPKDFAVEHGYLHVASLFDQALCGSGHEITPAKTNREVEMSR
jgi:antirestriction protein ArdC